MIIGKITSMRNQELKERIEKRLWGHTELNVTGINVTVEKGLVTLAGSVDGPIARATAEGLVRSIEGVNDVINNIWIHEQDDNLNQY